MRRRLANVQEEQQKCLGRLTAQTASVDRERETRERLHADAELRAQSAMLAVGEKLELRQAELAAHKEAAKRGRARTRPRTSTWPSTSSGRTTSSSELSA